MHPGTCAEISSGTAIFFIAVGSLRQALWPSLTGEISQASGRGERRSFQEVFRSVLVFDMINVRNHLRRARCHLLRNMFRFELLRK